MTDTQIILQAIAQELADVIQQYITAAGLAGIIGINLAIPDDVHLTIDLTSNKSFLVANTTPAIIDLRILGRLFYTTHSSPYATPYTNSYEFADPAFPENMFTAIKTIISFRRIP